MKTMLPARFRKSFPKVALSFVVSLLVIVGLTLGLSFKQTWLAQTVQSPVMPRVAAISDEPSKSAIEVGGQAGTDAWLRRGDRGPQVQQLHRQLQDLGYEFSSPADQFSATTEQLVLGFQGSRGLIVDGIVGPETDAALAAIATAKLQGGDAVVTRNGESASPALMPPDIQRILDRGKLVVAVLARDNPPFFLSDPTGDLLGADVKMAQQLSEQLGVELSFNRDAQTFNEVVDEVYAHRADLAISKISRTLKRAQRVSFSAPYLSMRQGLLVNRLQFAQQAKGDNTAEMLRTLEGKIGVIKGSSYGGFAKQKFPKATVVEYATWPEVVKAVTQGNIIAAYRDELEVKKIVLNNPDASLQFQTIALTDTKDPLAVVLPWDSRHLNDFVNQYLEGVKQDYTIDGLLKDYIDYL